MTSFPMKPQHSRRETEIKDINKIKSIRIGLASPDEIRDKSYGEVKNPETIDYKTHKPKFEGLFCERIFGPTKDYECNCGKFRGIKHKGMKCDRCAVEVTLSRVRRTRLGHINLEMPVAHIWFSKGNPVRMAALLDLNVKAMEQVLYYEKYLVIEPNNSPYLGWRALLKNEQIEVITEDELRRAEEEHGTIDAMMGAEAIQRVMKNLDLETFCECLRKFIRDTKSEQKRIKAIKRLRIAQDFLRSGNRPEWMILEALPVIPPDLRPLVPLDGGRFATSDLNDLYRRVINRNNRLKRLKEVNAPEVIIRNEKRMLQEAVDALLDNGRRGRPVKGSTNRPLKSLSDMLKGKSGRFRQNLLGKRVDYSGRSVIVCGPDLKFHECGLPKKMALELFEPFIIHHLEKRGQVNTIRSAKRMIEREHPVVYDVLEEVIKDHPVLLNRAPTLHRLGIQAFMPVLIEGNAIQLHPLTCAAFNADFDGDQMAVHVPLSNDAKLEAKILMLSSKNILGPADGRPIATPSQDIVLGCYYLTKIDPTLSRPDPKKYASPEQAIRAFEHGHLRLQEEILVRITTYQEIEYIGHDPETNQEIAKFVGLRRFITDTPAPVKDPNDPDYANFDLQFEKKEFIRTTVGRILFNEVLTPELRFENEVMTKKNLSSLVQRAFNTIGLERTSEMLDRIKDIGFEYAKYSGLSIALSDLVVPESKTKILDGTREKVAEIQKQYDSGAITEIERYNKVIDCWIQATDKIADDMMVRLEKNQNGFNPLHMMKDSGARGSQQQIRQLSGMRGLMNKPTKKLTGGVGEIIESPIESNFKEGLTVLEYFISTHGARKGLADTALKTSEAGYLTRRLVDVAQDVIVTEEDCGTISGIERVAIREGDTEIESLKDRIQGRCALETILNPLCETTVLIPAGKTIDEDDLILINNCGIENTYPISSILVQDKSGKRGAKPEEIDLSNIAFSPDQVPEELYDLLIGRVTADDVLDTNNILVRAGEEITPAIADEIQRCGIDRVKIRSVLCCEAERGVCVKCYGRDLARGRMVQLGEAVGIIAAQSIGEPGTQLTLRTFHIGGTTSRIVSENSHRADLKPGEIAAIKFINFDAEERDNNLIAVGRNGKVIVMFCGQKAVVEGRVELICEKMVENRNGQIVVLQDGKTAELRILGKKKEVLQDIRLPYGVTLAAGIKNKANVKPGDLLFSREPWSRPLVVTQKGTAKFIDVRNLGDKDTFEGRDFGDRARVQIVDSKDTVLEEHILTPRATVLIQDGDSVLPGDVVATLPLPVITNEEGKVRFLGIDEGRTIVQRLDPNTKTLTKVVTRADEHNIPRIAIIGRKGETIATYHLPLGCEIRVSDGEEVFKGDILANSENLRQVETIPVGATVSVKEGQLIECEIDRRPPVIATWDPYQNPIIARQDGIVKFRDIEIGVTVRQNRDQLIIMEQKEDKHPSLEIVGAETTITESLPANSVLSLQDGQEVKRGDILAKIPKESFKSRDVTGGLPRVEEIFEARRPKASSLAMIARVSGWVKIPRPGNTEEETKIIEKLGKKRKRGTRLLAIAGSDGEILEAYEVDTGKHLIRNDNEWVNVGDKLVDGSIDPHEYLDVMGEKRCMEYLLNEIQEVYGLQGVHINDKHIEVIIRQMMNKVTIRDPGDTDFLPDDVVDRHVVMKENRKVQDGGGRPARFTANLLGISKASLSTESFISAASFQETTRVLTAAAIAGKEDFLTGLKENVIMGHLIPAGTGRSEYRKLRIPEKLREQAKSQLGEPLKEAPSDLQETLDQDAYFFPEDVGYSISEVEEEE